MEFFYRDDTLYLHSFVLNTLDKARKHGIEVSSLEKKYHEIDYIVFEEPCFLLLQFNWMRYQNKCLFYTPFAVFELKNKLDCSPRRIFKEITGAKRIPRGKDAMKKIEALLLQASI
ncbi:hypothetical protein [Thermicanus aegyptius]|uniref:hypothetical protein n=1 Tax=Thermicanus aegyptius TaxID=94009 RepID=UPI000490927D|nr:hypothetical protein [Thermicanus aegyptius]